MAEKNTKPEETKKKEEEEFNEEDLGEPIAQGTGIPPGMSADKFNEILKMFQQQMAMQDIPDREKAKKWEEYLFWKTQPVPKFDEDIDSEGPIEHKKLEDVRPTPYNLPAEYEWSDVDIENPEHIQEVYDLLYENYVEDDDATFRFKYSASFLDWALKPPGWQKSWYPCVRVAATGKMVAFISAIPTSIQLRDNDLIKSVEINFLCVHKKLRSKRLAPVLIKEITRRVNQKDIWQALYTAGVVLPSPVSTCRYYHRPLNWTKLYEIGFSAIPPNQTAASMVARYTLPKEVPLKARPMTKDDVKAVHPILQNYLSTASDMSQHFTEEEVAHWFVDPISDVKNDDKIVYSYVVEEDGKVIDFFSFYKLDHTVLKEWATESNLRAAYGFYYATSSLSSAKARQERVKELVGAAVILANNLGFEVYNELTLLDNPSHLDDLKFGCGDGYLNYYLFNYRAQPVHGGLDKQKQLEQLDGKGVGVIML